MTHDIIRILIADDNQMVRYSLRVFIQLFDDFQLVGEAATGNQVVELCRELHPHLVLMDLVMPQMNGVIATEKITREFPGIKILVLTSTVEYDLIATAIEAGAQGYLLKNGTIDMMAEAIRAAIE
jgi:DNA-binding NarL/FixJ family response regulator